ncbi:cellulase family glycosylhydrolase [Gordonia sp. (in: high G+C Gram-positive bacteria)]|uniref:endoglycoceramidase I n=1 Tax=Gordonia sp. (in: high G+C Gram-positive bacteria) TaxID=84139 RepID=UPI002622219A|nr:cellulase family glycosylhydrolase [Gordonia sp. (in: high G+C Gram-positive bacteria)]
MTTVLRRLALALAALLVLPVLLAAPPARAATPLSQLTARGGAIVDAQGRTVLLHGVNNVDKEPPYVQLNDGFTLTENDAQYLADQGLNVVRLGVSFDGLMPERGRIDHAFIDRIVAVVDLLAAKGIYTLIDNHQDGLSSIWGGNGFPAWSLTARPAGWEPNPGFPLYYLMPSMNQGWDEVWSNKNGVIDYLGTALAAVADAVKGKPGVAGIELFNEPWPGTAALTCFPVGCPLFDQQYQSVMNKLTTRIQAANPAVPVWWEPNVTWNQLMPSYLGLSKIASPNVVISPHDYCIPSQLGIYLGLPEQLRSLCPLQHDHTWSNIDLVKARTRRPVVVTEFGDIDPTVIGNTVTRADERMAGWIYWHLSSGQRFGADVAKHLVRTYPQATAGAPLSMAYDEDTGAFRYTYGPNRATSAPTAIAVPALHYRGHPAITVDGGSVVGPTDGPTVSIKADGAGPVTVNIVAGGTASP